MKKTGENTELLKRAFDIGFSSMLLIGLSPVFLIIAAGVKLSSSGDVIYRQQRLGKNRKPFTMFKFRTMVMNAEKNGPQLTVPMDPRITGFGRFLRKYHLDELTQFWNVLKGDMSVVGPRPEREFFVNEIEKISPDYNRIFEVKPGITSSGMVEYGYASDTREMMQRSLYDLNYLDNRSFYRDTKIIFHTLKTILQGKGI